jgi:CubicO group peptidase (beta-lactamase class C family)
MRAPTFHERTIRCRIGNEKSWIVSRSTRAAIWLGVMILLLSACSAIPLTALPSNRSSLTATPDFYWPTKDWRTSTPEEQGMDSARLAAMLEWVQQQRLNLHSLLVIRNGYIVSETYFDSYRQNDRHQLFSCTKSFIATLIGIALDRGDIQRIDAPVMDFFAGRSFTNLDERKQAMTLQDLLTMRSGLDWQEGDPAYVAMMRSPDSVKYVLDKPMALAPGSQFNYCSGCSHVLSAILQQATGANTLDYAEKNLLKPLGINNLRWDKDPSGIPIGGWGLQLTPREMAKLGYLYLHDGAWEGRQIVSSAWVQAATQQHTETDGDLGYGYQWWVYPSFGAYTALGLEGQTIFVVPEEDLIVVTTASVDGHEQIFRLIDEYIMPSIGSN